MKRILVPISFNESSINLLRRANSLFERARLTLLHVYPLQKYSRKYDFGNKEYGAGIRGLLIQFYDQHIEARPEKTTFLARSGTVSDVIDQISRRYDLMVMSRKAHASKKSGYFSEKKLFIIAKAHCPVLIMPISEAPFRFENCNHIWHIQRRETEPEVVAKGMERLGIDAENLVVKSFKQKSFFSSFWKNILAYEATHDKKLLREIDQVHDSEPIDLIILVDNEQSIFINFLKSDVIHIFCQYDIPILVFPTQ